jgi:quercetin dioxygenase-like cupin family protein
MKPLIEHLAIDDLPWEALGTNGLRRRALGVDPETGRATMYVDIPQGWKGGGTAHYHDAFEEVFVIKGDVTLNGRDYLGDGSYIYRPAGIVHGHDEGAQAGCFCIIRTGGALELNLVPEPEDDEEYVLFDTEDDRPFMLDLRTRIMPWQRVDDDTGCYRRKVLSASPTTGDATHLVNLPPAWQGNIALTENETWEWLVLEGDARVGNVTASTLSYGCRPPGAPDVSINASIGGATMLLWRGA